MLWNRKLWLTSLLVGTFLFSPAGLAFGNKAEALQTLSRDVYIWGYPAVLMKHTREAMLAKVSDSQTPSHQASINHLFYSSVTPEKFFQHTLPTNSENLYAWGWLDLSLEPLIFTVPEISNRYFSVQFVDAYSNVYQIISNETSSGKASTFALTSPTWKGELPPGVARIKATTPESLVMIQTQVRGAYELSTVAKLNRQMKLVPLSAWRDHPQAKVTQLKTPSQSFQLNPNLATLGVGFLSELLEVTAKNPPPTSADAKQLQLATKKLSNLSNEEKIIVERGLFAGERKIEDRVAEGFGAKVNGWSYQMRAEPFREDYLIRAAVSATNLFSTPAQEIAKLKAVSDSEDRQLYSNYKYLMHFQKGELPPTRTSWTLKVFETAASSKTQVPDEIARINDQMSILKYNDDGSMNIYLQEEAPSKGQHANWLPLHENGGFFVELTIYNPNNSVLNRKFVAPAITRVEEDGLPKPRIVRTMMAKTNISAVSNRDSRGKPAKSVTSL